MKCTKCGSEIKEGASFCSVCGMPIISQNSNMANQNNTVNNLNEVPSLFDNENNGNTQINSQTQNMVMNNQDAASNGLNNQNGMQNNGFNSQNMVMNNQDAASNGLNNQNGMQNNSFNPQNNMMTNQPPYNNMVNNNQNSKKTPVGLIIGVIVAAVVIIAIFVGLSIIKDDNNSNNDTPSTNTQTETDKNDELEKKEEPQTVTYSDYNFVVPADFNASPSTNQLLITSADNNIAEAIIYQSGTGYDTLASMKDQIVSLLQAQENSESYDFTNAVTTEKTYDGTRFLITSGIKQGTIDLDIAYAETNGGVFVVSIAKTGGLINEADRDELYSIVASANQSNF